MKKLKIFYAVLGLTLLAQTAPAQAEVHCSMYCSQTPKIEPTPTVPEPSTDRYRYACHEVCRDYQTAPSTGALTTAMVRLPDPGASPAPEPLPGGICPPGTVSVFNEKTGKQECAPGDYIPRPIAPTVIADLGGSGAKAAQTKLGSELSAVKASLAKRGDSAAAGRIFDGGAASAQTTPVAFVAVPGLIDISRPRIANRSSLRTGGIVKASYCVSSHTVRVCGRQEVCEVICAAAGGAAGAAAGGSRGGGAAAGAAAEVCHNACHYVSDCHDVEHCDRYGGSGSTDGR